jgi:hypothetical protein
MKWTTAVPDPLCTYMIRTLLILLVFGCLLLGVTYWGLAAQSANDSFVSLNILQWGTPASRR